MILALPKELIGNLDFSYDLPILKDNATDKQKIIYADFIKQYITDQHNEADLFIKHNKN